MRPACLPLLVWASPGKACQHMSHRVEVASAREHTCARLGRISTCPSSHRIGKREGRGRPQEISFFRSPHFLIELRRVLIKDHDSDFRGAIFRLQPRQQGKRSELGFQEIPIRFPTRIIFWGWQKLGEFKFGENLGLLKRVDLSTLLSAKYDRKKNNSVSLSGVGIGIDYR